MEYEQYNKREIASSFDNLQTRLDEQITQINNRILSLQKHVITLEHANNVLDQLAQNEKDPIKKRSYYGAIKSNIELLARIYEVIKEFENTKFKYYKEIDDLVISKYRLIVIELKKLEGKLNTIDDLYSFFEKFADALKNANFKKQQINNELQSDPDYKL